MFRGSKIPDSVLSTRTVAVTFIFQSKFILFMQVVFWGEEFTAKAVKLFVFDVRSQ